MVRAILSSPLVILSSAVFCFGAAASVTTSGRQLLVNGQAFTVQGVDYSPIPPGSTALGTGGGCIGPYQWWTDRPTYIADFPLIKQMGANTVRAYGILNDTSAGAVAQVRAMLDEAQARGLYVIMNYYPSHFVDPTVAATQAAWQADFVAGVSAYKDHPAVLIWEFANEQNLDNGQNPAWYPFVNQVLGAAKAVDTNHPMMTVEGETSVIQFTVGSAARSADDANMTNLDLWGVNAYRGTTFQGLFTTLTSSTSKPVLMTEFGKDAYRDSTTREDQVMQAGYLSAQWTEIAANLSATDAAKILVGGVAFEWTDEWWKDGGGLSCNVHDTTILFTRPTDSVDPGYNDEWFGLTAVSPIDAVSNPSGTARTLRAGYTALQTFWNPSAVVGTGGGESLLSGTVRNYPNPFRVGAESTKFVVLLNAAAAVEIHIYDAGGQLVASLSRIATGAGRTELNWDGKNRQGNSVSPGLYIARIEAEDATRDEKQFRRVVAVR